MPDATYMLQLLSEGWCLNPSCDQPPLHCHCPIASIVNEHSRTIGGGSLNRIAEAERELNRTVGTHIERAFDVLWVQNGFGIPLPIKQHLGLLPRRYTFDRAWPPVKVAVEMEGGIWLQLSGKKSRHTYPPGMIEDMRKYNLAASRGWLVFRFSRGMLDESEQLGLVAHAIWGRLRTLGLTAADLASEQQKGLGDPCSQ